MTYMVNLINSNRDTLTHELKWSLLFVILFLIKRGNNVRGQKFFKTFFEEKNLPEVSWEIIANDGTPNWISNDVVIDHLTMDGAAEYFGADGYAKIEDAIRKIDFQNGDVNRYLHFLACFLVGANPESPENKYRKE